MAQNQVIVSGMKTGHVQGIAVDQEKGYIYYSFTTLLLKTDLNGNFIGSVEGLAGHLGCIAWNAKERRVYGSLEYKHDGIGSWIIGKSDLEDVTDGFYAAIFDVDKIDRMGMDAERDGIMTAVFLREVLEDYCAPGHRYGCSGIDGVTFAPLPGTPAADTLSERGAEPLYFYVAYGIYGDVGRTDNDHQIIHCYDITDWKRYEAPLNQRQMHRQGPDHPEHRYFVYTGNTEYGIQNLEYDPASHQTFAAVYVGKKPTFPNYSLFAIDWSRPAEFGPLSGLDEQGERLTLAEIGERDAATGIWGSRFPYGTTGLASLGCGLFRISRPFARDGLDGTDLGIYRFDPEAGFEELKG